MTDSAALVICYGNELRRDDGAGWAAGEKLAARLALESASVMSVHQLLPEIAEPISRASFVIFIDADAQLPPGKIQKLSLQPESRIGGAIGHHQSPQGLLHLAGRLYGRAPAALLFSIGGADFSYGPGLSPQVRTGLKELVECVIAEIGALRQQPQQIC